MQELTIPPQSTAPYTPAGGSNMPSAPRLGTPIPGTTGGLPTQQGLNVYSTPLDNSLQSQQPQPFMQQPQQSAQQVQSYGRGEDTMLVHMTPEEVNSLQGLAMAHGGSLTVNPNTGLPEAGFLGNVFKKLFPAVLGAGLAATGVGAPLAAGIVGLGSTALTGSLKKGLMAGLGAYGGASLAGAAGLGGKVSQNAFGALSDKAGIFGANMGAGAISPAASGISGILADTAKTAAASGLPTGAYQAANPGLLGKFAQTAKAGLPGGIISKAAPMLAASGLVQSVSGALAPTGGVTTPTGQIDNSYQGPYYAQDRQRVADTGDQSSSKPRRHFAVGMPEIYNTAGQLVQPGGSTVRGTPVLQLTPNPKAKSGEPMYTPQYIPFMGGVAPPPTPQDQYAEEQDMGFNRGGVVNMRPGSFVADARFVSEAGNGSSNAGKEVLARLGGVPVEGPGDGVSDSIKASIGGVQEARVARDEVIFPPEAVKRIGRGSEKRGTQKLYALMDKAHKARKEAKRGQDTGLRRGLV